MVRVSGPAVVFEDVGFAYPGGGLRMEGLSLDVAAGTAMAVVGPNGSGKSTLLGLMSGRLAAAAGSITVAGLDPARTAARDLARCVAVVSAGGALGFPYTVEETVLMGRAPHVEGFRLESPQDLEVAYEAMRMMDVAHLAGRDFDTLSSGERQRAAVARALAQQGEVLLLDEPAAFLDIKHQIALYELLGRLRRERALTVICVLHDLNLASLYFERLLLLEAGRVAESGPAARVLTAERVRRVFDAEVRVMHDAGSGRVSIVPIGPGDQDGHTRN